MRGHGCSVVGPGGRGQRSEVLPWSHGVCVVMDADDALCSAILWSRVDVSLGSRGRAVGSRKTPGGDETI
jgi:hypothetical protein